MFFLSTLQRIALAVEKEVEAQGARVLMRSYDGESTAMKQSGNPEKPATVKEAAKAVQLWVQQQVRESRSRNKVGQRGVIPPDKSLAVKEDLGQLALSLLHPAPASCQVLYTLPPPTPFPQTAAATATAAVEADDLVGEVSPQQMATLLTMVKQQQQGAEEQEQPELIPRDAAAWMQQLSVVLGGVVPTTAQVRLAFEIVRAVAEEDSSTDTLVGMCLFKWFMSSIVSLCAIQFKSVSSRCKHQRLVLGAAVSIAINHLLLKA